MTNDNAALDYFINYPWKYNSNKDSYFISIDDIPITIFPHKFRVGSWSYIIDGVFTKKYFTTLHEAKVDIFNVIISDDHLFASFTKWYMRFNGSTTITKAEVSIEDRREFCYRVCKYVVEISGSSYSSVRSDPLILSIPMRDLVKLYTENYLKKYPMCERVILINTLNEVCPGIVKICHIQ